MAELKPSTIAVPALSALAGGVVGALLTLAVSKPSSETAARPEPVTPERAATEPAPLDGRVAALERSVQALSLRGNQPRAAATDGGATAAAPSPAPVADVAPIVDNPVFEAAVRDVMDRAEQERNLEREAQRAEWRKQAAQDWTADVSEKLRLTEVQKARALSIAGTFWDKLRTIRQSDAGANLNRQEWRARTDELRTAAEAELAQVLSPAQMSSYRELEESSRLGSRRSLRSNERAVRPSE